MPVVRRRPPVAGDDIGNDCDGLQIEKRLDGIDNDGDGVKDEDMIRGRAVNHAPHAADAVCKAGRGLPQRFALLGGDPDGDPLSYRIVQGPSTGSVSIEGSELLYGPPYALPPRQPTCAPCADASCRSRYRGSTRRGTAVDVAYALDKH